MLLMGAPRTAAVRALRRLKKLQETLGVINDAATGLRLAEELAQERIDLTIGVAAFVGHHRHGRHPRCKLKPKRNRSCGSSGAAADQLISTLASTGVLGAVLASVTSTRSGARMVGNRCADPEPGPNAAVKSLVGSNGPHPRSSTPIAKAEIQGGEGARQNNHTT
jgi:hypothetical protein